MFKIKIVFPTVISILLIISGLLYFFQPIKAPNPQIADKVIPVITLTGDNPVNINIGDAYVDADATATDNIDGDISAKVVTKNDLNAKRIGSYTVNYSVSDKAGNAATAVRTVNVLAPTVNNTAGIPVLMYHFFYSREAGGVASDANFTEVNDFDNQIKYLVDNNYYFATWTELISYIDGTLNLPQKSVIITDDDGTSSFFGLAYPILAKYNVPVTSFLITANTSPANLNADRNLVNYQSHSHNMHRAGCSTGKGGAMQCISHDEGIADLNASKAVVGSSDVFCYPFGDYNDYTKSLLSETGYKLAVTTEYGRVQVGADKLALPRVRIQGYFTLDDFINSIK